MRKERWIALALCAALLAAALTACGGKKPFVVDDVVEGLEGSAAFSEQLERMDWEVLVRYYALDRDALTDGAAYGSTGATAEEFAVLVFNSDEAAKAGESRMREHLDDQLEANRDYRPGDMPKLEKAMVERRGNTLLLVVADDYAAAEKALG